MALRNYITNSGQAIMEYIIISALIGLLCLMSVKTLVKTLKTKTDHLEKKIRERIEI